ncbi:hypothetical protein I312_105091 [Cryptococcus bacillisporus CA1280]|uniref:uncharacterized protein n=1 Tax=Cryptococcus bacillisporus CA1280 TaxID=1296109 RepID=UPI0033666120
MSAPWGVWGGGDARMPPIIGGYWVFPSCLPSSHPFVSNPEGAIRDMTEHDTNHTPEALMILAKMPNSAIVTLHEQLGKLADAADWVVGAKHIKKIAKPILERSAKEKKQKEDEEAKKKQEAITAMWGGLWANDGYTALEIATNSWTRWPYPYPIPPGVAAQMTASWKGKGPEGWQPAPITALPQDYPFWRTGFYGLRPEEEVKKGEGKRAAVHVSFGAS